MLTERQTLTLHIKPEKLYDFKEAVLKDYHNDFGGYEMSSVNFLAGHRCPYCASRKTHPKDSVGQAIIDMYDEEYLWKIWNKELNKGLDPFKISSNSQIKIWWNCPDGKHKPFLRSCDSSIFCNFNCNKCSYDRMIGENSPRWNPNLTDEDRQNSRGYQEYIQFVKDIMARDNYTCQITGIISNGHNLVVHHLDGYNWCKERRVDVTNGIVIHEDIHKLFHHIYGYGNNTEFQFEEFLMKIESKEIDISNIN